MTKKEFLAQIGGLEPTCKEICTHLWNHPEIGGEGRKICQIYQRYFKQGRFRDCK